MPQPSRRIPDPGFAGDTGGADPTLAAALEAVAADPGRAPEVLAALHGARVLAAVGAVATETAPGAGGLAADKEADIALALLDDGAGRRALPVFSSVATLARWDPRARPVPVEGPRAAAVALAEGAQDLVVDLAGPVPVVLGEREVRALLRPVPTVPAYADEELAGRCARCSATNRPSGRLDRPVRRGRRPAQRWPWRPTRTRPSSPTPSRARLAALARASVLGLDLAVVPAGWAPPPGHRELVTERPPSMIVGFSLPRSLAGSLIRDPPVSALTGEPGAQAEVLLPPARPLHH